MYCLHRSYGESLQCLHFTFLACTPHGGHLQYLQTHLPDPDYMLPLCFPRPVSAQTTTPPAARSTAATTSDITTPNAAETPLTTTTNSGVIDVTQSKHIGGSSGEHTQGDSPTVHLNTQLHTRLTSHSKHTTRHKHQSPRHNTVSKTQAREENLVVKPTNLPPPDGHSARTELLYEAQTAHLSDTSLVNVLPALASRDTDCDGVTVCDVTSVASSLCAPQIVLVHVSLTTLLATLLYAFTTVGNVV